jgi:hypothetical protein
MPKQQKVIPINLRLDPKFLQAVDEYRFRERHKSRQAALRQLLESGMKAEACNGRKAAS